MDLVKICFSPLCSCLQSPVVRQDMSYVFSTKEKLDDLNNAMKDLMAKKNDIQSKLDHPQNKGKLLDNQLQRWLDKVGEKNDRVDQLLDEYHKGNCVAGFCCLNCFARYKISSDAIKLEKEINQLKGEQMEISLVEIPPPKPVPASHRIFGKGISSKLDTICSYLADETVRMVGIWGMGGVGKTTLLRNIYQLLLDDDANMGFDHVFFIVASQNIQLEKLREEIAKKLPLASSSGKEDIFNVLEHNNFVLLLDDIWEEVDLADLGIPHPCSNNNSTRQYKHEVIFTTRSEDVCARMGVSKRIRVECLEADEAWDLFKDNVKLDVIESDEKFKKIARQVMNKCGGLPLALKVIGKSMSNKKAVQDWEFVLKSLKNSGTEAVQGVQESLFPILKFSYDNLPRNIQECFLWASLLGWLSEEEVLECWMGLGLIGDFDNLQEAYYKERYIINTLEEACLLSFADDEFPYVKVHDVIYEMAMWIASDCGRNMNKWIVKQYEDYFGPAVGISSIDAENWRFANRVIILGGVVLLPIISHQYSDLKYLIIRDNFKFTNISVGFFRQMPNLIYLDLSSTEIKELPKDIKCLVNLQYLNISFTDISSLPKELVSLNKLEYLICRNLIGLGKIDNGLMSRSQKLKVIDIYPSGWVEAEELKLLRKHVKAVGMRVVSLEVLQQLSCLSTTQLCIHKLDNLISLPFDTFSCKNHHRFLRELAITSCPQLEEIVMNGSQIHLNRLSIDDVKKLQNIIWTDILPPEFFHVLKMLDIGKCNLANFSWVLHLPCLSYLTITDCEVVETLFYVGEREIQENVSEWPVFPALLKVVLTNLPKLVSISNFAWDFPRLSFLAVLQCPNLKKLPFKRGINDSQKIIAIPCEKEWWESLEWDDATVPPHLRPRFRHGWEQDDNPNQTHD